MQLDAPKRYSYFIKTVADWECVWGLYQNGWALTESPDGKTVFPFWPAEAYAQACAKDEWKQYVPEAIPLTEFMGELLPRLKDEGILLGIFYVLGKGSVDASYDLILEDLNNELSRIED